MNRRSLIVGAGALAAASVLPSVAEASFDRPIIDRPKEETFLITIYKSDDFSPQQLCVTFKYGKASVCPDWWKYAYDRYTVTPQSIVDILNRTHQDCMFMVSPTNENDMIVYGQ